MKPPDRIILVPGLLEPAFCFWPLRYVLAKQCQRIEFFPDRLIFRNVQQSIDRLSEMLAEDCLGRSTAIVTHSFGDWVARQAIARASHDHVGALVSVAPVMRAGLLPTAMFLMSGKLIPEIKVIMESETASANLDCDQGVRRLVIWAKIDESLREVDLSHVANLEVTRVAATHLSVIVQPGVLKRIEQFLFSPRPNDSTQSGSTRLL